MAWFNCGTIDWTAVGSMLSGIGTVVGAGAVFYAAHKGSDTFRQWRRQKNAERRIELAEQILTLAYKVRRAFEGVRSPAIWGGERADLEAQLRESGLISDETPEGTKVTLVEAQAVVTRANYHKNLWDSLLDMMPVAKAIFGDEIEAMLNEFWTLRTKLLQASKRHATFAAKRYPSNEKDLERRFKREAEIQDVIWSGASEDGVDKVADAVNAAVHGLECKLLIIIRSDTSFGL